MVANLIQMIQRLWTAVLTLMVYQLCQRSADANPTGGVVGQGAAKFTTSGSSFTINQSSANAFINWSSFNIGAGETTTFNQPSATSVAWNQINGASPSQILGSLNANGYVILQNPNGFYVGGSAVLNAHGLVMTTSTTPAPNLDGGGPWSFSAPPPTAKIVNYGQINLTGGGSGYLIASDIENNGTISAPGGQIGLYAGQKVLLSTTPDGHGLSAEVTLPNGSVDNEGKLIADAGTIMAQAKTVNQNGLVQANSIQNVNGTIELVADNDLNLGGSSTISAHGDITSASAGGKVTLKGGSTFTDQAGSVIDIAGGSQGGNSGQVEISAPQLGAIQSQVLGKAGQGYAGGKILIDPIDYLLDASAASSWDSEIINGNSDIEIIADHDINVSTLWETADANNSTIINLLAGHNINIGSDQMNGNCGIMAGKNISLSLSAGTPLPAGTVPNSGDYGIYLWSDGNGNDSFLQTKNGSISLWAANEIQVGWEGIGTATAVNAGAGAITTTAGGSIKASTLYGDVNAGSDYNGYDFPGKNTGPYYKVDPNLGGISTAAGGNVAIIAGGNVYSYLPLGSDPNLSSESYFRDAGTGAFGPEAGDVTVTAGGSVYGHYVVANGTGTIMAEKGNVGSVASDVSYQNQVGFALSLVDGSWTVDAPNGSIYLQEVRNPNGALNAINSSSSNPGWHVFNYDPNDSLTLAAGDAVEILGNDLPRNDGAGNPAPPIVLPPTLNVTAGQGGFVLDDFVTLYQSSYGNVNITTTAGGNFEGDGVNTLNGNELFMSDSDNSHWNPADNSFVAGGSADYAVTPTEFNNHNPVVINISGNMDNVTVNTSKATQITVGGDMKNSSVITQNLKAGDVSFVKVAGAITYSPLYTFVNLTQPLATVIRGDNPDPTPQWFDIFSLLVNPAAADLTISSSTLADLKNYYDDFDGLAHDQFSGANFWSFDRGANNFSGANPGFTYNPATLRLGFTGQMSTSLLNYLTSGQLEVVRMGANGLPIVQNGHLVLDPVSFADSSTLDALYAASQTASPTRTPALGLQIGGPGEFNVDAGSVSLGNSGGIESLGITGWYDGALESFHNSLAGLTTQGASIHVDAAGNLDMLTSRIVSAYGGDITVNVGGSMDLGTQEVLVDRSVDAYGIYTTGDSNIRVVADGDINIDGSRIATFNGGDVFVESRYGNVNVGSGGNTFVNVELISPTSVADHDFGPGNYSFSYQVYGSGIVTTSLPQDFEAPGTVVQPGNIIVEIPRGNITSSDAGILQYAMDGSSATGPKITVTAGTPAIGQPGDSDYVPAFSGNIDLGHAGVIGGAVDLSAQGNITGVIISRQDSTVNSAGNFSGLVLSSGSANVSAGGSVSGEIIGVGSANVSGSSIDATVLSQNASVGGGSAQSTLGTATGGSTAASAVGTANSENAQKTTDTEGDDDLNKKKKLPMLQRVKRVTVLLGAAATR